MKTKLTAFVVAAVLGLPASGASALVINFIGGTPSDILNGGSLLTTPGTTPLLRKQPRQEHSYILHVEGGLDFEDPEALQNIRGHLSCKP